HPDLDRICRKLPIICQVPANASTTFRFKPLLQKALRIVQVRLLNVREQLRRINLFEEDINQLEKRIGAWQKHEAACRAIYEVPGIGRLTATALVATIGDAKTFRSGREFAVFLGLVPRQNGTGGKIRLGSISRRGDPYLRTLLIHGARSVLCCHTKVPTAWQKAMQARRPANVVAVALANKMARIA
ncbi:IS110 family transposase, partial [Paraburkholderia sp. BR10954]|uniref:IS110 family transposase n=1 Tax=Paraburkholderia sp. BR10954 TaxID=3236995 RepID=UPI0034D32377